MSLDATAVVGGWAAPDFQLELNIAAAAVDGAKFT
jgi:hypothetical protein